MVVLELIVVLLFIFLGARIGGIGIGLAGGAGVIVLTMGFGLKAGSIPIDVILIIMSVIAAIAAMQVAGGLDWMVDKAEKFLRRNPSRITFYAPIVTYLMTLFAGTGHTAFSTLPVISEVAKEQGIRPSRPLSIAVIASQIAITASPISAAVVALAMFMGTGEGSALYGQEPVDYLVILAICIPSTFIACMVGALVANFMGKDLKDDPIYQERLAKGLIVSKGATERDILPTAKTSVIIFLLATVAVVSYATMISSTVNLIENPPIARNQAIMAIMLMAATLIVMITKIDASMIANQSTFRSGMTACICVLGVAWLGNTFVANYTEEIKHLSGDVLKDYPWLLAVALFFASMLLYSQASTTKALMPTAFAIGVSPVTAIASFAAVSALFVLPTYPTLLAAVEMDDTGSTRIGKYVFNHPFMIPGVITIAAAVALGFVFGGLIL